MQPHTKQPRNIIISRICCICRTTGWPGIQSAAEGHCQIISTKIHPGRSELNRGHGHSHDCDRKLMTKH